MATPSQLYIRSRVLFIAGLIAIISAFASLMIWTQRATGLVLGLLVLSGVLLIGAALVRRAAETKRMGKPRGDD